jgi:aromatic ring hydroxylase
VFQRRDTHERQSATCAWDLAHPSRRANIEHYEKLLARTTDEAERLRILKLLEEERHRQAKRTCVGTTQRGQVRF